MMKTTLMITSVLLGLGTLTLRAAENEPPPGEARRPVFDQLDANHDGVIDRTEWDQGRTRLAERRGVQGRRGPQEPGLQQRGPRPEPGADRAPGRPSGQPGFAGPQGPQGPRGPRAFAEPGAPGAPRGPRGFGRPGGPGGNLQRPPFVDRFDANHDGKLDDQEWQEFRKHIEQRMEQQEGPPPPEPGQE